MPVAHFHLANGSFDRDQRERLLVGASKCYSEVLDSPIERVRAFIVGYEPEAVAVGGRLVADGASAAPYFTAIVLAGRPAEQRHRLLARFTDLVVETLGVPRDSIRGQIIEVKPENWGIAGVAASAVRAEEIAARTATGS